MMDKHEFEQFWQDIKTQRDELHVRMHLAAAEIKTEWQFIEDKKWPEVEHKLRKLAEDYEENAEEFGETVRIVGEEIRGAYNRIKTRLKDQD